MTRYTRQEAKLRGFPTCYGSPCPKHPELEGHRSVSGGCVECARAQLRARRAANPDKTRSPSKVLGEIKTCNTCRVVKPLREYHRGRSPDGYRYKCKICVATYKIEYRKKNSDKIKQQQRAYDIIANPIRKLYYQQRYVEKRAHILQCGVIYRKAYPHKHAAIQMARRSHVKQRTPSWLTTDDHWFIGEIYELAALRTKMFGFAWHVDHIIPLQGKNVSGLHVPLNLRVIPGAENVRKSNQYEVVA